ncbi:MAG: insulinase family protein [Chitinophagales bacterium]|nr:insulinase family protein [Chitinophagales bacterium]MCZ2392763.1 insulinase family protein [Chitinophagales bacterium]
MNQVKKVFILGVGSILSLSLYSNFHPVEAYCKKKTHKKNQKTEELTTPSASTATAPPSENNNLIEEAKKQLLPLDPNVLHGTLPNGMQYFIRKNSKPENRMELRLVVNAGSNQEDDDQKGLAHFLEHMAFNGSQHFKKNDLVNYVERIGTKFGPHLNAYTSFDETVYMLQVPTDKPEIIDSSLLILEDWANGLSLPVEEIDKERGVVISEWRSSLGPQQRMQNQYLPILFHNSRYADRLPIGDTAIIKNAPAQVIQRFYKDWYRPDLMAVVVVGDIDPKAIEAQLIKRFSDIPTVTSPRKKEEYPIPPHQETLISIVTDKEAPYTQVMVFEKHPSQSNNNIIGYREMLKQQIINYAINERLDEILQQPTPPFFGAMSSYENQLRRLDAFAAIAVGTPDKTETMLKTLYEQMYLAEKFGITKSEYDRASAEILNSYETALNEKDKTESANYAGEYVDYYLSGNASPGIEIENQLVQILLPTIALEEINEDFKKMITHKNTVVIITSPENSKSLLPTKERILEIQKEVAQSELKAIEEKEVTTQLLPTLPQAGKISKKESASNGFEKWTLSNGATVWVKKTDFKNDEILVHAFSPGGSSLYADSDFFSITNSAPLINESGYGDFDKISLNKALVGKTVSSSPYIRELEEGINASTSPKDIETLFQLLYLNFTSPKKDSTIYLSYINKNKSLYSNLLANPAIYFQKVIYETLFQNNVRKRFPEVEDFDKINFSNALQFYKERFNNASDFNFVVIGNVDTAKLSSIVEQYIASLPSTGKKEIWKDTKVSSPKGKVNKEVSMGAAPKVNSLFYYSGDKKWTSDDELVFDIMTSVLNIKLREILREDKGGVYGVGVQGGFDRIPTPEFHVLFTYNADPNQALEIEKAAMDAIENLKKNPIDEVTLNKVKETIKREVETDIKENSYWVSAIKESVTFNEPIKDTDIYLNKVQNVSIDQIQKAFQEYLNGANFIRIIMSPEK